ncbi:MAG: hypothetical protein AAB900_01595 [Patescibacteria group bacterium]
MQTPTTKNKTFFSGKTGEHSTDFNAVSIKMASPERILEWSYG